MSAELDTVIDYHRLTYHRPNRFAPGPGYLDWDNQPEPFRRFAGADAIQLPFGSAQDRPFVASESDPPLHELTPAIVPSVLSLASISQLLERSMAISAWKQFKGKKWALRINPSSGNLHPTECYLVLPALDGLVLSGAEGPGASAGVYHYRSVDHTLERRAALSASAWNGLLEGLPAGSFLVGFSSVIWREAWKYGERAFRYCQHDVGHAIAAMRYATATLGWSFSLLDGAADGDIAGLLGLDRERDFSGVEPEHPDVIGFVVPLLAETGIGEWPSRAALHEVRAAQWTGTANRLSAEVVEWDGIAQVAVASAKETREPSTVPVAIAAHGPELWRTGTEPRAGALQMIRQRRSATDFDGVTTLPSEAFFRMLDRTLPRRHVPPLDAIAWRPAVHLALFVHRVDGLTPGVYMLVRDPSALEPLRAAMQPDFDWEREEYAPAHLPLYRLAAGDVRDLGRAVSCHQDIAGAGAFSLGMIAEFEPRLRESGAWFYRRLYWECGAIGQVFYLEAEAHDRRATGIGCFFDPLVHELLGLRDARFQSLYHLAVGQPVDDARLTTLPAY